MELNYNTDMRIWLHLEDYHNAGLTQQQTKEIIEKIIQPFQGAYYSSTMTLHCQWMGLNGNLIVTGGINTEAQAEVVVYLIQRKLDLALKEVQFNHRIKDGN